MTPSLHVKSRTLARLPRGYSITVLPKLIPGDGLPSFVAGSEGDDALVLFEAPDFRPKVIAREPGGYISTCPVVREGRRFLVASTQFKPGFDAASARMWLYPLDGNEPSAPSLMAVLPYTHRVITLTRGGRDFVLASTLCAAKASKEDWTQPGGVFLAEAPDDLRQPWSFRPIIPGLNKNHGMEVARLDREGREGYLLSAMEGLFFTPIPADPMGAWTTEPIATGEYSDACAFDWNRDGIPEIFSISPFHGNVLSLHRSTASGWEREVIHQDLSFGHIVWAGDLLGGPALLAGSRRDRRELRLYRPSPRSSTRKSARRRSRSSLAVPTKPSSTSQPMGWKKFAFMS